MSRVANHIRVRHTTSMISGTNGPRCSHMIYSFAASTATPTITTRPPSIIQLSNVRPRMVESSAKCCMTQFVGGPRHKNLVSLSQIFIRISLWHRFPYHRPASLPELGNALLGLGPNSHRILMQQPLMRGPPIRVAKKLIQDRHGG